MRFLKLSFLVALIGLHACCYAGEEEEERLPGWKGETYSGSQVQATALSDDDAGNAPREPWIETVSWVPRAFVYHGFLSHEECDDLIKTAVSRLSRSQVVSETGDFTDPVRTSYSASLGYGETPTVAAIEDRIAQWTHLPQRHGEPIEVLRYLDKQKYDAHWDWFEDKELQGQGNRMATVLMYLSDVEPDAGGETALPLAEPLDSSKDVTLASGGYSECASKMGISIVPRKGDALLFWDMGLDGKTADRAALHASCPILKGNKWTATKWIHCTPY